jgi:hypothetical protein
LFGWPWCTYVSGSGIFGGDCSRHFTSILNTVTVFALAEVQPVLDPFSAVSARSAEKKFHLDHVSRTSNIALYSCNRTITLKMAALLALTGENVAIKTHLWN